MSDTPRYPETVHPTSENEEENSTRRRRIIDHLAFLIVRQHRLQTKEVLSKRRDRRSAKSSQKSRHK